MAEVQLKRGWGKALQISDKFVLILHIFLITMEKYENDKNDFLQTQRIKQLDKYSISIKYSYLHLSTNRKLFPISLGKQIEFFQRLPVLLHFRRRNPP